MESNSSRQLGTSTLISLVAVTMLAAGCGGGSSPSKAVVYTERPDDESCLYQPEEGDSAAMGSLPATRTESFFFGKKIDSARIQSVYRLSAKKTVEQIQTQGAKVYGVKRAAPHKCERFSFLTAATYEAESLWKRLEDSTDGKGQIAGVFFPAGNRTDGVTFQVPTIIVGYDSNRYVVTHEYMHFLYDAAELLEPGYLQMQDLVGELNRLNEKLGRSNYKNSKYSFTLQTLSEEQTYQSLSRFLELFHKLISGYNLEEVAIESKFFDDYTDSRYKWMPDGRKNSINYMVSSFLSARESVTEIREFAESLTDKIRTRELECIGGDTYCSDREIARLKEDKKFADLAQRNNTKLGALIDTAYAVVKARYRLYESGVGPRALTTNTVGFAPLGLPGQPQETQLEFSAPPCPHGINHEIDSVLKGEPLR